MWVGSSVLEYGNGIFRFCSALMVLMTHSTRLGGILDLESEGVGATYFLGFVCPENLIRQEEGCKCLRVKKTIRNRGA